MRSEKEIHYQLHEKSNHKQYAVGWRSGYIDALEWVLGGDKEAVAKPLLGDGWRDARKELPNSEGYYLCFYSDGDMKRTWWYDANNTKYRSNSWHCKGFEEVIAWRELPDPPAFA